MIAIRQRRQARLITNLDDEAKLKAAWNLKLDEDVETG